MRSNAAVSGVDVVVVGGGIVGAATAAHVALTGRRVLLVEAVAIGAGASGRNSGVVQHPFDPLLVSLHRETLELYRALEGFDLPAAPVGLLSVTRDVEGARALADSLRATHPHLHATFLAPDEVHRLEPAVAGDVAACRLDIGYPVGPAAATNAYVGWAGRLGVDVVVGEAAALTRKGSRVTGVRFADGRTTATADVVVAAGPWTPEIVDPTGTWRPIRPSWGVVVTVTLPEPPRHVIEEAEISIEPGDERDVGGVSFSLVTADGATSLGSTFLPDEPDVAATVPRIVERGGRFVPAIADARLGPSRICARPLSLDGRPLIGRVPGIDGLWVAAGHGPWGISTGPASGRLLADLIDGRLAAPPPELEPARFGVPPLS
jgi:glycine/D-amino acid oxidase-like deaminating enzyme